MRVTWIWVLKRRYPDAKPHIRYTKINEELLTRLSCVDEILR